jgi:DNA-binding beta-propeller fold protein YncE
VPTISYTIAITMPPGVVIGVAVTPDGNYLYATNFTANSIVPIDISNPASPVVGTSVTAGIGPGPSLVITPEGSFAYVPNTNDNSVTPVNITNRAAPIAETNITVGSGPVGMVITTVPASTGVSGTVKKNIFLSQTAFVLVITWTPNTTNTMASPTGYNIYLGTSLVQTVSAKCPPVANVYLPSCNDKNNYFISTVYSDGTESMHVPVVVS